MGLAELIDAWNAHDPEAFAAQFTDEGVRHQYARPEMHLRGRACIAQEIARILHAVPDATLEVRAMSAAPDGRRVTMEWTLRGTHQHDYPGLPGCGATVNLPGVSIFRLADDGRVAWEDVYWDRATLMDPEAED